MSPQKIYLDEPAIRLDLNRVRFPKLCPVCGTHASLLSRITISSRKSKYLNRSWDPYYSPYSRIRQKLPRPKLRVLPIYVCGDHYDTDDGAERYKSCCFIIDGFALIFLIFGLFFIGDAFYRNRPFPLWSLVFSLFFVISMTLTWIAFRPTALQRAVQIVGFDPGMQNVMIIFRNRAYREAVINENPMTSELVSWIVKPDS